MQYTASCRLSVNSGAIYRKCPKYPNETLKRTTKLLNSVNATNQIDNSACSRRFCTAKSWSKIRAGLSETEIRDFPYTYRAFSRVALDLIIFVMRRPRMRTFRHYYARLHLFARYLHVSIASSIWKHNDARMALFSLIFSFIRNFVENWIPYRYKIVSEVLA